MEISSSINGQLLIIDNSNISNLLGFPKNFSDLIWLEINGRKSKNIPVPLNFISFKGLPKKLPFLKYIEIYDSIIPNLESLTVELPSLHIIRFHNCRLHSLKGIPNHIKKIVFMDCDIDSFEGLSVNNLNLLDSLMPRLYLYRSTFSSLYGISVPALQSVIIEYFTRFGPLYKTPNLSPTGNQLFTDCIDWPIYNQYCPIEFIKRNFNHINPFPEHGNLSIDHIIKNNSVDNMIKILYSNGVEYITDWNYSKDEDYSMENWIYGFNLEELLFIPEKINNIIDFYRESPIELAQKYIDAQKSLSSSQIKRLIHESDPTIRQLLENSLPLENTVIEQISAKFSFKSKNKFPILK